MNVTYDPKALSTYSPGCYDEINTYIEICKDFKAEVISSMNARFEIVLYILVFMIFLQAYLKYWKPKFTETEFYKKRVDYRIDFITLMVGLIAIAYLFL